MFNSKWPPWEAKTISPSKILSPTATSRTSPSALRANALPVIDTTLAIGVEVAMSKSCFMIFDCAQLCCLRFYTD